MSGYIQRTYNKKIMRLWLRVEFVKCDMTMWVLKHEVLQYSLEYNIKRQYFIEIIKLRFFWKFLMMQEKKYWCVYLSFVNKQVLQNNCLNKKWDGRHCNSFIVLIVIAVLIIHANNKHSAWYFYLYYHVNKHALWIIS